MEEEEEGTSQMCLSELSCVRELMPLCDLPHLQYVQKQWAGRPEDTRREQLVQCSSTRSFHAPLATGTHFHPGGQHQPSLEALQCNLSSCKQVCCHTDSPKVMQFSNFIEQPLLKPKQPAQKLLNQQCSLWTTTTKSVNIHTKSNLSTKI